MNTTEQLIDTLEAPGLPPSVVRQFYSEIAARYDEPWRHYHTIKHLADVTGYLLQNADELNNPRVTLWAALSHDEVYIPGHGDNEELSARMAESRLDGWLPRSEVEQVGSYIRATADHAAPENDHDLALLFDADMKILGTDTRAYAEYEEGIRQEYHGEAKINLRDYTLGRLAVLRGFEKRPRIFVTDTAHAEFEQRAHQNLQDAIATLGRTEGGKPLNYTGS